MASFFGSLFLLVVRDDKIHLTLSQIVTKQGRFHMTHTYES